MNLTRSLRTAQLLRFDLERPLVQRVWQARVQAQRRSYADKVPAPRPARLVSTRQLGVGSNDYIPPTGDLVPTLFQHPKLYWRHIYRQTAHHSKNFIKHIYAWYKYRLKYDKQELKQKAEELYIDLNAAFAKRDQNAINACSGMFVSENLKERLKAMDPDWDVSWQLEEFLEEPRLIDSFPVDMGDGGRVTIIQAIYRFHSKQKLELTYRLNKKAPKRTQETEVLDYIVFVYDTETGDLRITGSLFESPVTEPVPVQLTSTKQLVEHMKDKGDIYRKRPVTKLIE